MSTSQIVKRFALSIIIAAAYSGYAFADASKYNVKTNSFGEVSVLTLNNKKPAVGTSRLTTEQAEAKAVRFVRDNRSLLQLPPNVKLQAVNTTQDKLGHSRTYFLQFHKGLPVLSSDFIVNLDANGEVIYVGSEVSRSLPQDVRPRVDASDAAITALESARPLAAPKERDYLTVTTNELSILPAKKLNEPSSATDSLVFRIVVAGPREDGFNQTFYVDALSGEVVRSFSNHFHSAPPMNRRIYDCGAVPGTYVCYIDEPGINPYIHGRSNNAPVRGPHNNPAMPQYLSENVDEAHEMAQL
ncbi:MAG: hypothetical protein KDD42_04085, partial [Bdellovibrionales bacterium]|nr:hypothetical protein [Bdellovibrionales bacterium]